MDSPAKIICEFATAHLHEVSIEQRIKLTRALASLAPTNKQSRALARMADELEEIERRHQQLLLNFRRRAEG